jgi:hypothetical protein
MNEFYPFVGLGKFFEYGGVENKNGLHRERRAQSMVETRVIIDP